MWLYQVTVYSVQLFPALTNALKISKKDPDMNIMSQIYVFTVNDVGSIWRSSSSSSAQILIVIPHVNNSHMSFDYGVTYYVLKQL